MKKEDIAKIENYFREANAGNSSDDYAHIYDELKSLEKSRTGDYLLEYYKGLSCYLNPDTEQFRLEQALVHFKKSFSLNNKYLMTRIYLGHCYFDLNKFSESLVEFKSILKNDWEILNKNDQQWRYVNIAELAAICNLQLKKLSKFKEYCKTWQELFYMIGSKENFYFPKDMIKSIAAYLNDNGDNISEENIQFFRILSLELINIIKGEAGFEEIYKRELEQLKNWDNHTEFNYKVYSR